MSSSRSSALDRFGERRLWLWLGVAATAALVALIAYLLLRGGDDSRRDAVAAYIQDLNRVQIGLAPELRRVDTTYRKFRLDPKTLSRDEPKLARSEATIERLRKRLAALHPPPEAARLHARILRTVDLEKAFAHDLTRVARVLPLLTRATAPLTPANARVGRELKAATTAADQERAFRTYADALRAVAKRIAALPAPPVLAASFAAQAARLRTSAKVMDRLGLAARQGNRPELEQLNRYLRRGAHSAGATRAERDAVIGYNGRLREIARARVAVERERVRLDRTLH